MKLVITTQIRENYAAHEGFNGSYRWKYKGGNTYVVPVIDLESMIADGIHRCIDAYLPFITEHNDYFQEYVLNWEIVDDADTPWESWEDPCNLELVDGQCRMWRTIDNTREYGYMRRQIAEKRESWLQSAEGRVAGSYNAVYTMINGDVAEGEDALCEWLQKEVA